MERFVLHYKASMVTAATTQGGILDHVISILACISCVSCSDSRSWQTAVKIPHLETA